MVGRYYYHRLLPLSVAELKESISPQKSLEMLLQYGNFPEGFFTQSEQESQRIRAQYFERILKEDIIDFSNVKYLSKVQLLVDLLRRNVGAPVSIASLARDIQVSHPTITEWIDLLEQLYIIFKVTPFHKNIARSILKESKIYFFDCLAPNTPAARLENLVAISLLKHLWFLQDTRGDTVNLHYLKNKDQKELDFLTLINDQIEDVVEVKTSEVQISENFKYFSKYINPHRWIQIVKNTKQEQNRHGVEILPAHSYLSNLAI